MEFVSDLPARGRKNARHVWADEAEEIREAAGQWGLLKVYEVDYSTARSTAVAIQKGRYAAFQPAGAFEAATRSEADGLGLCLYVRYVGDGDEE